MIRFLIALIIFCSVINGWVKVAKLLADASTPWFGIWVLAPVIIVAFLGAVSVYSLIGERRS